MKDWNEFKTSAYFKYNVLRRRPYLKPEWFEGITEKAAQISQQPDGRIRTWVYIPEADKFLRVVILEDGETLHNAFFDRGYKGELE